jgi:meso-butanediol dehydrogenase/(S,S)-butanediol dehydrogenase/diacetyl reductase
MADVDTVAFAVPVQDLALADHRPPRAEERQMILKDKVAIVTGAASGIGRAAAQRFAAEGASVLVVDLNEESLAWTAGLDGIEPLVGSVADPETSTNMTQHALDRWGKLDVVYLNAGVPAIGSILDPDLTSLETSMAVNFMGVVHGVRAAAAAMLPSGGGSIVVTASVSALGGDVGNWAYNAAKAGAMNLVRSVAGELAQAGIRINAVCPGATMTGMTKAHIEANPEFYEAIRGQIPMKRWAEPEDVANAALWLASDEARYVTGVALPVDGGVTAMSGMFPVPEIPAPEQAQ